MQKRKSWFASIPVFSLACFAQGAFAQTCYAPERPFVPTDPKDVQEYRDLIGRDFETYIADIQSYFLCLEEERARAFEEAREVSEEYGRFMQITKE